MTTLGVIFSPDHPPEQLREVAVAADAAGLEQLWLWEDCFCESGVAAAAAVLGWTESLRVGVGLFPVPLRNVALTAMEIATLERLFPGRLLPGVGHGVLDWMGQVGARVESPMTLLREYTVALRSLLHGETVTTSGRYVRLEGVALAWPPVTPPALLVGAVKPKTLELATSVGDGVILTGSTTPDDLHAASAALEAGRRASGHAADEVVVFVGVVDRATVDSITADVAAYAAAGATTVALHAVGDDSYPLTEFVRLVASEVRAAVG